MKKVLIALALLISAVVTRADDSNDKISQTVSLKVSVSAQGASITNSTGTITYASPHKYSMTNATFLKLLALGEHALGDYTNVVFPSGSKLVLVRETHESDKDYFVVTDKKGNLIVDVSDLIKFNVLGKRSIESGKVTPPDLDTKHNQGYVGEIEFDDTEAGGNTSFYMVGVVTVQTTDTVKTDFYNESRVGTMASGIGDGVFAGGHAVLTGSVSFAGVAPFPLPEP